MFLKANLSKLMAASAAIIVLAACGSSATPQAAQPTAAPAATVAETTAATEATSEATTSAEPAATQATAAEATAAATDVPATEAVTSTEAITATETVATDAVASTTKFNLNTATAEEILSAPNTGNRMVREFEEYRPYTTITQFRREIGKYVDEAQVAEYEKYFYVPVSPNNSDTATLQQLPGVDATIADRLIAARPFASRDAFIAKLGELTSVEQATTAAVYVEAE